MRKLFWVVTFSLTAVFAEGLDADLFKNLKFRFIGPDGNRAIAVVGAIMYGATSPPKTTIAGSSPKRASASAYSSRLHQPRRSHEP